MDGDNAQVLEQVSHGAALRWERLRVPMWLSSRVSSAHAVTLLVVLQGHVRERFMQSPDTTLWSQLKDLMVFFSDFAWDTLTLIAVVQTAGTVPTTAFNQETTWPENGIGSL